MCLKSQTDATRRAECAPLRSAAARTRCPSGPGQERGTSHDDDESRSRRHHGRQNRGPGACPFLELAAGAERRTPQPAARAHAGRPPARGRRPDPGRSAARRLFRLLRPLNTPAADALRRARASLRASPPPAPGPGRR
ncbi:MAG: hypothetical protein L6R19_19845 [Alphaproteobacteria bacterium]|nr:hypothetical protein [Alphaproteobacteria bacterium]